MVKRLILLSVLFALLLPCVGVGAEELLDGTEKIESLVLSKMETVTNSDVRLPVMVILDIPGHSGRVTSEVAAQVQEELQEEINRVLGDECDYSLLSGRNIQNESWNRMCQLQRDTNEAFGKSVLTDVGIDHSCIIKQSDSLDIPDIWVNLTVEEIYKIAAHTSVTRVIDYSHVNERVTTGEMTWVTYQIGVFTMDYSGCVLQYGYNAGDALRMLRTAVGNDVAMPENTPDFVDDPNGDGKVNAQDALWALQHAVGKRTIEFSIDLLYE